jgi:hypothetical protein
MRRLGTSGWAKWPTRILFAILIGVPIIVILANR